MDVWCCSRTTKGSGVRLGSWRRYAWSGAPLPLNGTTRLKLQCDSFHMNFSAILTLLVENLGHRGRTKAPRVHGELRSVTTCRLEPATRRHAAAWPGGTAPQLPAVDWVGAPHAMACPAESSPCIARD